jgi:pSer/pThr/pTyr-binding forkhead associated (FHA) protein
MEKSETSAETHGLPFCAAHWRTPATMPVPADFLPLRLILQPGGAIIELTQPDMLIGRHSLADIRLPLPDVSRRHCRFLFGQGVWQVIDLNSLNGVYLNGGPIRQATLQQGDLLRIGGFTFAVDLPAQREASVAPEADISLVRRIFKTLSGGYRTDAPDRRSA